MSAAPVVPIVITLHDELQTPGLEAVEIAALDRARALVIDLALGCGVNVTVTRSHDEALKGGYAIAVAENELWVFRRVDATPLTWQIGMSIWGTRTLFITEAVTRAYASAVWPEMDISDYSIGKLRELMSHCVDRNVSIGRLYEILRTIDVAMLWDTWALLLRAHAESVLVIAIPRALATTDPWEPLQRHVFHEFGVLCPVPVIETVSEVATNESQFRINDVRFPLIQLTTVQQVVDVVLHCISAAPQSFLTRETVKRQLNFLRARAPVLADEVMRRANTNQICGFLDDRLRQGKPVKNFEALFDRELVPSGTAIA